VIAFDVLPHPLHTLGIKVVRENHAPPFRCRKCKGANACKNVYYDLARLEQRDQPLMLVMQAGIPVDCGKIEGESTARFALMYDVSGLQFGLVLV
jgi:hypothetical protein